MSLELIQAKRHVLMQQLEQLNAQMNATRGAIVVCDELMGEELAEQSKRKAAAEAVDEVLARAAVEIAAREVPEARVIVSEAAEAMPELEMPPAAPVEMIPVTRDDDETPTVGA
jgi:hypothetical protein